MSIVLTVLTIFCAVNALRANSLLSAAIWLAGVSALTAVFIYSLGAPETAVIELSVGAGLVTVIFVFAISVAGEEAIRVPPLIRHPLAWAISGLTILLLGSFLWPIANLTPAASPAAATFGVVFWEQRGLDALAQIVLIFVGALTLLSLLGERPKAGQETAVSHPETISTPVPSPNGHPKPKEVIIPPEAMKQ
jgi:uncharacterized MnhB-related membrane protein